MEAQALQNLFKYHPPLPGQAQKYERLREAAHTFAKVVIQEAPPSADRTAAIRKIRESVMTANASIACARAPEPAPPGGYLEGYPGTLPVVRDGAQLDRSPAP